MKSRYRWLYVLPLIIQLTGVQLWAEEAAVASAKEYIVGVDDILDISVLQPEKIATEVTVSPDGNISFPYIGTVKAGGMTLSQIQEDIRKRLADGFMKYPVVAVSLKESRSRKFFVYGEVTTPGAYPLNENMTVFKALSVAGGFTKFGASSRVKILRPKQGSAGYETIKVNLKAILDGNTQEDVLLEPGDVVVVTEGVF